MVKTKATYYHYRLEKNIFIFLYVTFSLAVTKHVDRSLSTAVLSCQGGIV